MKHFLYFNRFFLLLLVFCFLFASENAHAEGAVKVGIYDFPPFFEGKEGGEPGGIWLDLMKNMLEQSEIDYSVKAYPTKRLLRNLIKGETDITIISKQPETEDKILYSRYSVGIDELRIYTREDTYLPKSQDDLKGKRIISLRGYTYNTLGPYLQNPENHITLDISNTHELAFRKLKAGRADYLLDYSMPAERALKDVFIPGVQSYSILKTEAFFAISKKTPYAQKIMDKVEDVLKKLRDKDGLNILGRITYGN